MLLFSEKLYVFPCQWNFRPDHCKYGLTCESAKQNGISVVHGSRQSFHNEKEVAFKAIFNAFKQVPVFLFTIGSLTHHLGF